MRCEEVKALLDMRLDGDLPEELAHDLDGHLLRCVVCGYEARSLEQTRAMVREAIAAAALSPAFRERAAARLLDAFAASHPTHHAKATGRQWLLPFTVDDKP